VRGRLHECPSRCRGLRKIVADDVEHGLRCDRHRSSRMMNPGNRANDSLFVEAMGPDSPARKRLSQRDGRQHGREIGGRDHITQGWQGVELQPRSQIDPDRGGVLVQDQPQAMSFRGQHQIEIGDVVEAEDTTFERPPETLRGTVREMILGVHKLNHALMHVLDIEKACQMTDVAETAAAAARG